MPISELSVASYRKELNNIPCKLNINGLRHWAFENRE